MEAAINILFNTLIMILKSKLISVRDNQLQIVVKKIKMAYILMLSGNSLNIQ